MFVEKVTLLKTSLLKSNCVNPRRTRKASVRKYTHARYWAGPVFFTDSWSLTSSLRVGQAIATLLDSMRESIIALHCNL